MSVLTLVVQIDSTQTDGNVSDWSWMVDSATVDSNPPPRMKINTDSLAIQVTDNTGRNPSLGAFITVSPKVENPLKGQAGKAGPFKQGNTNGNATVCCVSIDPQPANGGIYVFTPPDNVFLEKGAWELTLVLSGGAGQFELDPEFDTSN
jgi:hypothetical protein